MDSNIHFANIVVQSLVCMCWDSEQGMRFLCVAPIEQPLADKYLLNVSNFKFGWHTWAHAHTHTRSHFIWLVFRLIIMSCVRWECHLFISLIGCRRALIIIIIRSFAADNVCASSAKLLVPTTCICVKQCRAARACFAPFHMQDVTARQIGFCGPRWVPTIRWKIIVCDFRALGFPFTRAYAAPFAINPETLINFNYFYHQTMLWGPLVCSMDWNRIAVNLLNDFRKYMSSWHYLGAMCAGHPLSAFFHSAFTSVASLHLNIVPGSVALLYSLL